MHNIKGKPDSLTRRVLKALFYATKNGRGLTRAGLFTKARCHPASEVTRAARDLRKRPYHLTVPCSKFPGDRYGRYFLTGQDMIQAAKLLGVAL